MSAHELLSEADLTDEQREALARLRAKRRERTAGASWAWPDPQARLG